MPPAARLADDIGHTNALTGLIAGAAAGLAIGALAVAGGAATVLTGGLAAPLAVAVVGTAIVAGSTAGLGQAGKDLGATYDTVTGHIITGSPTVFINFRAAARGYGDSVDCAGLPPFMFPHHHVKHLATGSGTVLINNQPAARKGDSAECSAIIGTGSDSVIIGGPTVQTREITSELPAWIDTVLNVVSIGSAVVLFPFSPLATIAGFAGSYGGGAAGHWLGGMWFGEGSDGQARLEIIGSEIGGALGDAFGNHISKPSSSPEGPLKLAEADEPGITVTKEYKTVPDKEFNVHLRDGEEGMVDGIKVSDADNRAKGVYGEAATDNYLAQNGADKIGGSTGHHGIDGIYTNPSAPPDFLVVDSKFGTSQLADNQMTKEWVSKRLSENAGNMADEIDGNYTAILSQVDKNGNVSLYKLSPDPANPGKMIKEPYSMGN